MAARMCKDGRIWGQNNKSAGDHLGTLTRRTYVKKGFNPNSKGRPFKKGHPKSKGSFKKGHISWSKLHPELLPSGENHYNWKGGISNQPYPFDFTKALKKLIRKRDNYKCQLCGCPQTECYHSLDVHHIDYDKENIDPKNLLSLCPSCHIKTNHNRDYWIQTLRERANHGSIISR